MRRITRRRLLWSVAVATLPVALPAAAEGKPDVEIVQALIDSHRAAVDAFNNAPDEIWENFSEEEKALGLNVDRTADAMCFYRPSTIEGVHLKSEFMFRCQFFVDVENEYFTKDEMIGGFLPPGKDIKPWKEEV